MCVVNQEKDSPPQHNKSHLESPLKKKKEYGMGTPGCSAFAPFEQL